MTPKDTIERFLFINPLGGGFPDKNITMGVDFEVGGAYETWGWIVYRNGDIYSCHKNLDMCLKQARDKFKAEQK